MFTRMTLAAKLRLLTTGAVLLTTLLVLTIAVTRTITDSYQRLSRKGDTLAQMVAQNSEFAVYTQDVEALRKITQGLRADAEVAYVRFIAADGRTLLQEVLLPDVTFPSAPAGPGRPAPEGERRSADGTGPRIIDVAAKVGGSAGGGDLLSGDVMGQASPSRTAGLVQLGLSEEATRQELKGLLNEAVLVALAVILLGFLLSNVLIRRISRRSGALVGATQAVARGQLDVEDQGLRSVTRSASSRARSSGMVQRLRAYRAEVEDYQRGLERKVEERTRRARGDHQEARQLARAGGGGQPREVAVPRQHEPRDPHADERRHRHDRAAARDRRSTAEQREYARDRRSARPRRC